MMEEKKTKKVSKAKVAQKDELKEALLEFYQQAKQVKQMTKDGILWRKINKAFVQIDFDKVEEALSKSK